MHRLLMGAPRRLHRPASTECATAVQRRRRRPPPASLRAYDLPGGQERQSTRRGAGARHAPRATCRRRSDQDAAPALDLARSHEISTQKPLHMAPAAVRAGIAGPPRPACAQLRPVTPPRWACTPPQSCDAAEMPLNGYALRGHAVEDAPPPWGPPSVTRDKTCVERRR